MLARSDDLDSELSVRIMGTWPKEDSRAGGMGRGER